MKIIKALLLSAIFSSFASGATVNITSGLTTQGVTVTSGGLAVTSFYVAAGNWNGSVFTQFGNGFVDTDKINGQIIATSPTSLNGLPVHLFIGSGSSIANSAEFIIVGRTTSVLFPADVTGTGSATFAATSGAVLETLTATGASVEGNTINFVPIPEPSTALLGLLGVAGLIRRRR
jgi:hypothetical protein